MKINIRRGLMRIWLSATIAWVVAIGWVRSDDIRYAYRFIFQRSELNTEYKEYSQTHLAKLQSEEAELATTERALRDGERREINTEYGRKLKEAGLPSRHAPSDPRLVEVQQLISSYKPLEPPGPAFDIIPILLLPPIAALIGSVMLWKFVCWIYRGFRVEQ